ncbi:MAG: hypothetical protein PHG11_07150 [Eubacteriales bacterium]|nr:hypothetical protein [Eubacteriales bacterium]
MLSGKNLAGFDGRQATQAAPFVFFFDFPENLPQLRIIHRDEKSAAHTITSIDSSIPQQ